MTREARRTVVHVLTVADSLVFIDELVRRTTARGFEVVVVTSPGDRLRRFGIEHRVTTIGIEMPRRVTPLGDWEALCRLRVLLTRLKPHLVHAHTPKGGLLGSLAAQACRVPVRLYQMRGLPFLTQRRAMRALMQTTERLACASATRVICQSHSLLETAVAQRIVLPDKATVVLGGSNGVDSDHRFNPAGRSGQRLERRAEWRIPGSAVVVGFVGRVVKDKGVPELLVAFETVARAREDTFLVVAGPLEERDPIDAASLRRLRAHPKIRAIGFTHDTASVYAASDLIVLPSHREGFPNVPLEAASMGLPVISTRVPGCVDAVDDGRTGLLVRVNDAAALANAIARYVDDPELRVAHGSAGRARVVRQFRRGTIADAMLDLYEVELSRRVA